MDVLAAFVPYFGPVVAGIISAWLCAALWTSGVARTCRSLNLRIIDLEQAHVQLRNKGYAQKRWTNQEQLEAELASLGSTKAPAKQPKFANDPLDF